MKRISIYIPEDVLAFLKKHPGTLSKHIRQAISEYMVKLFDASISLTKEGGEKDGKSKTKKEIN